MEEHVIYLDKNNDIPINGEGFDKITKNQTEQEQPLINKSKEEEKPKKEKLKRRYFTRGVWAISLIGSAIGLIFADAYFGILITLVFICFSTMFNIISVYIITGPRYFNTSAYWTVFTSYILAFTKMILFILDTAECISHGTMNFALEVIWQILYWSSMLFNFVWIQFIYVYWTQGHPDTKRRIKGTLRYYLIVGAIIGGIGITLLIIVIIVFWSDFYEMGIAKLFDLIILIIQIINMAYSWIFYFLLFGYGISALPYYLYISTDTTKVIHNLIEDMKATQKDFEYAVNKYIKNTNFFRLLCDKLMKEPLIDHEVKCYVNTIQESIKMYQDIIKFNGVAKYNEKIESDFKKEKEKKSPDDLALTFTIDKLAEMYMTNQNYIFSFEKKEKMLLKQYYSIRKLCDIGDSKTIFYQNLKTKEEHDSRGSNSDYKLPLTIFSTFSILITKISGIFFMILSSFFYLIQLSIPIFYTFVKESLPSLIKHEVMFYPLIVILVIYCIYVIICSYFALTKFKKLESYTLVTHHTDKYAMLNNAGMLNTIVFGIIYNICLFSYEPTYTTNISKGFAFFSQKDKGEGLVIIILWVYPLLFTLFGVIFILKIVGFKLAWIFKKLETDNDFKEEIIVSKQHTEKRVSIAYSTDDLFFKFLENFEEDYYSVIITV